MQKKYIVRISDGERLEVTDENREIIKSKYLEDPDSYELIEEDDEVKKKEQPTESLSEDASMDIQEDVSGQEKSIDPTVQKPKSFQENGDTSKEGFGEWASESLKPKEDYVTKREYKPKETVDTNDWDAANISQYKSEEQRAADANGVSLGEYKHKKLENTYKQSLATHISQDEGVIKKQAEIQSVLQQKIAQSPDKRKELIEQANKELVTSVEYKTAEDEFNKEHGKVFDDRQKNIIKEELGLDKVEQTNKSLDIVNKQIEQEESRLREISGGRNPQIAGLNTKDLEELKEQKKILENKLATQMERSENKEAAMKGYKYNIDGHKVSKSEFYKYMTSEEGLDRLSENYESNFAQVEGDEEAQAFLKYQDEQSTLLKEREVAGLDIYGMLGGATANTLNFLGDVKNIENLAKGDAWVFNQYLQTREFTNKLRMDKPISGDAVDKFNAGDYGGAVSDAVQMSVESLPYSVLAGMNPVALAAGLSMGSYVDLRLQGASKKNAALGGVGIGVIGTLDGLITHNFLKGAYGKGASKIIAESAKADMQATKSAVGKEFFKHMVLEPTTEGLQGGGETIVEDLALGRDINWDKVYHNALLEASAAGPTTVAAMPGYLAQYALAPSKETKPQVERLNTMLELSDRIVNSKTKEEAANYEEKVKVVAEEYAEVIEKSEEVKEKSTSEEQGELLNKTKKIAEFEDMRDDETLSEEVRIQSAENAKRIDEEKSAMIDDIRRREDDYIQAEEQKNKDEGVKSKLEDLDQDRAMTEQKDSEIREAEELGEMGSKENFIHENLGRIRQEDFNKWGDRNNVTNNMRLTHFNKGAAPLDVLVKELSEQWGTEITEQDVIDYIEDKQRNPEKYKKTKAKPIDKRERAPLTSGEVYKVYEDAKKSDNPQEIIDKARLTEGQKEVLENALKKEEVVLSEQKTEKETESGAKPTQEEKKSVEETAPAESIEEQVSEKSDQETTKLDQVDDLVDSFTEEGDTKESISKKALDYLDKLEEDIKKFERGNLGSTAGLATGFAKLAIKTAKVSIKAGKSAKDAIREGIAAAREAMNKDRNFKRLTPRQKMEVRNEVNKSLGLKETTFDEERSLDKIKQNKKQIKKNIRTKLGMPRELLPSLMRVASVNPDIVPEEVMGDYMSLMESLSEKKKVLKLEERNEMAAKAERVNEAIRESEPKMEESDDSNDKSDEEKEAERREEINYIQSQSKPKAENFSTRNERDFVREFNKMFQDENILNGMSTTNLKTLADVLDNMNNNHLPHAAYQLKKEMNAIKDGQQIAIGSIEGKPMTVEKIAAFARALSQKKNINQAVLERNPLFNIDQMFGDFKTTRLYDAVFQRVAKGWSAYEARLQNYEDKLNKLQDNVLNSFKGDGNKAIESSFKQTAYRIQQEFESNQGRADVAPAKEFLEKTIDFIKKGKSSQFGVRDAEVMQSILDTYFNEDIDSPLDKLWSSFNKYEKESIEGIAELNKEFEEDAEFTAGVLRGQAINPLVNYTHRNVISNNDGKEMSPDEYIESQRQKFQPSTKSGTLIDRKGGASPINFDVYSSSHKGAKQTLLDFHMTEAVQTAKLAVKKAENLLDESKGDAKYVNSYANHSAIASSLDTALESVLSNSFHHNTLSKEVANYIKSAAYRAMLGSARRFVQESISNLGYVLLAAPKEFAAGVKYNSKHKKTAEEKKQFLSNLGSSQTQRVASKGIGASRFVDSMRSGTKKQRRTKSKLGNLVSKAGRFSPLRGSRKLATSLADGIITAPDKMMMQNLWIGTFGTEFKKLTGEEYDDAKIQANDEAYMTKHKEALDESVRRADEESLMAGATDNTFMGLLKGKTKEEQLNFFNEFNNFMTRFLIFEFNTFRTGWQNLAFEGKFSRKKGAALMGAVVTRMTLYSMLGKAMSGMIYGLITGDNEDEDKNSMDKVFAQSLASSMTSLVLGRNMGNISKSALNIMIEMANKEYGQSLRDGEYDPYEDALQYTLFSPSKQTKAEDFFIPMLGAYSPIAKTLAKGIEAYTAPEKKEQAAIERNEAEKYVRFPLEVLGNLGYVPMYKDVREVVIGDMYKDLRKAKAEERKAKEKAKRYGFDSVKEFKEQEPKKYKRAFKREIEKADREKERKKKEEKRNKRR